MKTKPENTRDLARMIETSSQGWFDGAFDYEPVRNKDLPLCEGDVTERVTRISVPYNSDLVRIQQDETYITKVKSEQSYSASRRTLWTKEMAFEEFAASEWFEKVTSKFADGDADASPFEHITIDEYQDGVYIALECERHYKDWLGNHRLDKKHHKLEVGTYRDGTITIKFGDHAYEGDVYELMELIDTAIELRKCGITLDKNEVRIPLPRHGDDE